MKANLQVEDRLGYLVNSGWSYDRASKQRVAAGTRVEGTGGADGGIRYADGRIGSMARKWLTPEDKTWWSCLFSPRTGKDQPADRWEMAVDPRTQAPG